MQETIHPLIDAHIHIDHYSLRDQKQIISDCEKWKIEGLIAVSNDLALAKETLRLAQKYPLIQPACGFHPEQSLPPKEEIEKLLNYIDAHHEKFVAIGEVGLPYYMRQENPTLSVEPYIEVLEQMMQCATLYDKPIVLHAVYEDAPLVCDLLEKYNISRAHFHWFKGDTHTIERMLTNGYCISVTPDVLYKEKIRTIVSQCPLDQLMVETDGPWPFEGKFKNKLTHPWMMHETIREIASIKGVAVEEVYHQTRATTKEFYGLE